MSLHCEHSHSWIPAFKNVRGWFDKRGVKKEANWFIGDVFKCVNQPCSDYLFVSIEKGLQPVECELQEVA